MLEAVSDAVDVITELYLSNMDEDSTDPKMPAYLYGHQANQFAGRATQAWLAGRGLAAEAQDLQGASMSGPVLAPGLLSAVRQMGDACTASCNAANTVFVLLNQELDASTEGKIDESLFVAHTSARETEMWTRRIAALCGGVSAHLAGSDDVERADRAAVVTLKSGDEPMDLVDDGLWHVSTSFEEFSTEIAGDFFRMVLDHNCLLVIEPSNSADPFTLRCRIDGVGNLTLTLDSDKQLDLAALIDLGWSDDGGALAAYWEDPLSIREPVELIKGSLGDHLGISNPTELRLSIRELPPLDE